jgi:NADH-quinone oxidoreductase subunit F
LYGKPTCINNVETWVNVPPIITHGAAWYREIGTETSKGTKVFSLVGRVNNTGLVEVPMGVTLRELVYDIGGGIPGGKKFKAVQSGGPSGGCIPAGLMEQPIVYETAAERSARAAMLDLPIDYESLTQVGSMMGSGGLVVMDEDTCMVDMARYFLTFAQDESCGACTPCRVGTRLMLNILTKITEGQGTMEDLATLEEIARTVKETSVCGLGKTAPNPVLTTLRYFRGEYERHIRDKRCDAFVCKELVGAACQTACPLGTEAWRYVAHLARGEYQEAYRVIRETNPFPSVCARVCDHKCEQRCRLGTTEAEPIAIRALKRFITDHVDPSVYRPVRVSRPAAKRADVAIVGAGPAGLTAAHYLSLEGFKVAVFEAGREPGGMLISGIPAYRLPREVLRKEIASLIDENVSVQRGVALGRDFTIDDLFARGYKAVFLALGAHKGRRLNIEGEDLEGVYPSLEFLKAFNLQGKSMAKGRVGVIGGGNSAVDAARVAWRQEGVESVAIFYRRTRVEMPALVDEVYSALQEGIRLETLVSPTRILSKNGRLSEIEFIKNELGSMDSSGRREPVPMPGTEFSVPLDTLLVAIGEEPDIEFLASMGIEVTARGRVRVDPETLAASRPGVFAGGDIVTGSNTVVDAIAAGMKAAVMIRRYLRGEEMREPSAVRLPRVYVQPAVPPQEEASQICRGEPRTLPIELRWHSFAEVEMPLSEEDAIREARRCLRCDVEFTERKQKREDIRVPEAKPA